jgi:23S rRNA G2445 N2-methylase RlmL
VYISLGEASIKDFDMLFDFCQSLTLTKYLTGKENIVIEASSTRSLLSSVPKIQSV